VLGSSVPGAEIPAGKKGVCTLEPVTDQAGDRTVTLQCPSKALPPAWGESVGGVSGRAGAKAGGSNPSAYIESFAWRGGERHPGLLEGGSLRGASSERGPRSVRSVPWVSSRDTTRADDSGCPEDAEEGNVRQHAPQSARTRRRHERSSHALGDASFARSFDPCMSILTMLRRRKPRRWGVRASITVGQPRVTETNLHWGFHGRT